MAVNNSLQKATPKNEKVRSFEVNGETVELSPSTVRKYLVNGNGNVTDQEVVMFINLCRYQKLNPLVKDAYLIKYGNQPATIVTGKDAILKRAMRNPRYEGHQAGVIVMDEESGQMEYRVGSFVLPHELLIGGWAKTFVKGHAVPIESAVDFNEYAGKKSNGELNSMWASKPGTMIRKVALVTSMREAFPEDLGGLYAAEEVNADIDESTMAPVQMPGETERSEDTDLRPEIIDVPSQELEQVQEEPTQTTMDDLEGVF